MDTPQHGAPLPQLPDNLDDPVALESWRTALNAWITDQGVRRNWPWLGPITTETLREILEGEKQLRADITRGYQQVELDSARSDLNKLEDSLRNTDPQYEAKRKLLVPILKPLFKHIPPANWRALFEQAYARACIPPGDQTPEQQELAEGRQALNALEDRLRTQDAAYDKKKALLVPIVKPMLEKIPPARWAAAFEVAYAAFQLPASPSVHTGAEPKLLDWSAQHRVEEECRACWTKDIEKGNRGYIEHEIDSRILPELRQTAWNDKLTEQQYRQIVGCAWMVAKHLFYALHRTAQIAGESKPRFFWFHQELDLQSLDGLCLADDNKRGFAISKDDLSISAANYLKHPEVRTSHLDWLYLDAMIFCELDMRAKEMFFRRIGITNWAAAFAGGNSLRYALLLILFRILALVCPGIAYWFHVNGQDIAANSTLAFWGANVIWSLVAYPSRRKGNRLLSHLLALNRMLEDRTISPRKLREKLDAATADGVALDGAVIAIVDRMIGRDPTALVHLT